MTPAGLQLRFRDAPGVDAELHQLAELERDCCAFADLSVHPDGEQVVLDVAAADEEGVAAVQAMFNHVSFALTVTNR
jgi:ketosteroid isomerase-like protein